MLAAMSDGKSDRTPSGSPPWRVSGESDTGVIGAALRRPQLRPVGLEHSLPSEPFPHAPSFMASDQLPAGAALAASSAGLPLTREAQLSPGVQVGEYVIEAKVGEGGMGTVYRGRHPLIGKCVAIKVIKPMYASDPVAVERFVREARAVNEIRHRSIIDIFAFGTVPNLGLPYFVMEYLEGHTLQDEIANRGRPWKLDEVLSVLRPVFSALEATHTAGVIHRDVKPENIFIVDAGRGEQIIKLLDFGLVKLAPQAGASHRTSAGMPMGTPDYMAPEQSLGRTVDHRADIYSLGIILYTMLAGRLPFAAESSMEVLEQQRSTEPPPLSVFAPVTRAVENAVLWALRKDPAARPQSVRQLHDAIEAAAGPSALTADPGVARVALADADVATGPGVARGWHDSDPAIETRPSRRPLLPLALGGGAVIVVGAFIAASFMSGTPASGPAGPSSPAAVESAPGTLRIDVQPADAVLTLDLIPVAAGSDLPLKAGRHHLRAIKPGFEPYHGDVVVAPNARVVHPIVLKPLASASPATRPSTTGVKPAPNRRSGMRDEDDTARPSWMPQR